MNVQCQLNGARGPLGPYQEAPEAEAALLVGDRVLAVQAAVALTHGLHGHVTLSVTAQRLDRTVAAGTEREKRRRGENKGERRGRKEERGGRVEERGGRVEERGGERR